MSASTCQVRPVSGRLEGVALAAATLLVTGALAVNVHFRSRIHSDAPLYDWQVSAFGTLTGADQAVYNALFTAKDEVPYMYDDINSVRQPGEPIRWPNLQDFQDYLLPPMYRDHSWVQMGSLQWSLHEPLAEGEMQGSTMYLGTDGRLPKQGSFLLVIGHVHAGFTNNNAIVIWWNARTHVEMPVSGFRDRLILQGWREVVPYSGKAEVNRIAGTDREDAEDLVNGALGK